MNDKKSLVSIINRLNRFRWISWGVAIVFTVVFLIGEITDRPALEALSVIALFVDIFISAIRLRCPYCKRALRVLPPLSDEEYCPYCGSKIE